MTSCLFLSAWVCLFFVRFEFLEFFRFERTFSSSSTKSLFLLWILCFAFNMEYGLARFSICLSFFLIHPDVKCNPSFLRFLEKKPNWYKVWERQTDTKEWNQGLTGIASFLLSISILEWDFSVCVLFLIPLWVELYFSVYQPGFVSKGYASGVQMSYPERYEFVRMNKEYLFPLTSI